MSVKNQIAISLENNSIKVLNATAPTVYEYYPVTKITQIETVYADNTAANAYTPGHMEFSKELLVFLTIQDIPNKLKFDIQNVTNQATWTHDAAGLLIAAQDIRNWCTGATFESPSITAVNFATASATTDRDITFSSDSPWSLQIKWTGLNAADGTIQLFNSNDGVNYDTLSNFTTVTMATTPGSTSIEKKDFPFDYLRIRITKGTNTTGTVTPLFNK